MDEWMDVSKYLYFGILGELDNIKLELQNALESVSLDLKEETFKKLSTQDKGYNRSVFLVQKAVQVYEKRCILSSKFLQDELQEVMKLYSQLKQQLTQFVFDE